MITALMTSPVGGFLKAVPRWVWIAIAIGLALLGAYLWHQHAAGKALKAADQAGYDRAKAEDAAALKQLREKAAQATGAGRAIADDTRSKNDETNRAVRADAADLLLRGPGASRCRPVGNPAVPATGGQPQPAPAATDAARALLSVDDRLTDGAVVPWRWLVARAEASDLDRAEVIAWRNWYQRQAAEWKKLTDGNKPSSK